jgi:hypothetical protein
MILENTPRTLPKGSRDLRSLRVLRNFRLRMCTSKGTPKGSSDLPSHPVTMLLLRKINAGKSRACAEHTSGQGHFRTEPLPVTWLCHFRSKGPTRVDIAQLPVAHAAHNILPVNVTSGQGLFRSRDWCHFRSCDFRLLLIAPHHTFVTSPEIFDFHCGATMILQNRTE